MTQTKIGLSMLHCLNEGFPPMLKRLETLDVHYIEFVDDGLHILDEKRVETINHIAGTFNFECTVHAPFADINIAASDHKLRRFILKRLERSIQHAHQLDSLYWIFHPGLHSGISSFYPGWDWQINLESVRSLLELGRKHEVKIIIENVPEPFPFLMKSVDDFSKFFEELGEDIKMVLDVGHANLNGQICEFMEKFKDRIVHMHVSDNDGKQDMHLGVGKGTVNWQEFAKTMKKTQFHGVVMIESVQDAKESLSFLRELLG
ncbi:MAG: sugar phosphate isomerase/epimerase family protein [Candidatus Bathyarchaeia archaeon]|nr:sugar phosphate isomerase/epimerase [Candidatus Bathyarchaeota archaeon A05DMB-4]MDH7594931.1 sugar phosphate isomerase/epimerase [Candidatus Bathyarchaeota archaeon]